MDKEFNSSPALHRKCRKACKDDGLFVGRVHTNFDRGLQAGITGASTTTPVPKRLGNHDLGFASSGVKAIKVCSN